MVLAVDEDELIFQITNSSRENHSSSSEAGGIGLKNIKKRLDLLYHGRYQLEVDKRDSIFTVFLTIRFSTNK
jgi:sensor histidine kinase YesM